MTDKGVSYSDMFKIMSRLTSREAACRLWKCLVALPHTYLYRLQRFYESVNSRCKVIEVTIIFYSCVYYT